MNVLEKSIKKQCQSRCLERDTEGMRARVETKVEVFLAGKKHLFIYVQLLILAVMLFLIIGPAFLPAPPNGATAFNNISLFASFLVWGLWFPLVFVSVIFFGRLWCGLLCPQGALSEQTTRVGLQRSVPKLLRWGGAPVVSFIVITVIGQVIGVREYPLPAVLVFIGTTLLAVFFGFIYAKEKRVWCRYLCPVGPILGIFSRLGAVSFEKNKIKAKGYPCPTFINTSAKTASSNCIECFKCVNPGESGSLHLKLRRPGLEVEEIAKREPKPWEVIFLFTATGLALGAFHWLVNPLYIQYKHILGGFFLDNGLGSLIGNSGPWWVMVNYPAAGEVFNWLDFISISSFMLLCMVGVGAALFFLTGLSTFVVRRAGEKAREVKFTETLTMLGYQYAPVALVSLVIGLGLGLFQSLETLGISADSVRLIQVIFFALGAVWSLYLGVRLQNNLISAGKVPALILSMIPSACGVFLIALLWHRVLF